MRFPAAGLAVLLTKSLTCFADQHPCVKVGLIGEFARPTARTAQPFGAEIRRGATIAIQELATHHPRICPNLEIVDIKNTLANIPDAIKKAILEHHVEIFLGMGTSDQALIAQRTVEKLPALLVTPTASSDALSNEGMKTIMLFPANSMIATELARAAFRKGVHKTAIIYGENSKYSADFARLFEVEFERLGGRITAKLPIRLGKISKADLLVLKNIPSRHVLLPLYELDAARVIAYLHQNQIPVEYIGTDSWGTYSSVLRRFTGNIPIHAFFPVVYSPKQKNSINQLFVSKYHEQTGKLPTDLAAFSYDGIKLINKLLSVCSIRRAIKNTSNCLKQVLPMDTTTGRVHQTLHFSIRRNIEIRNFKDAS